MLADARFCRLHRGVGAGCRRRAAIGNSSAARQEIIDASASSRLGRGEYARREVKSRKLKAGIDNVYSSLRAKRTNPGVPEVWIASSPRWAPRNDGTSRFTPR